MGSPSAAAVFQPRESPLFRLIERYWPCFERTYAERQAALSAVEADLADRQIDLFKALGGTW